MAGFFSRKWNVTFATTTILAAAAMMGSAQAAPVLNTTNFISSPAFFNGFESIPNDGTFYTGGAGPYTEGGISVSQINGDPANDIWVNLGGLQGSHSWYPNAGDHGYTRIALSGGADFADISLNFISYGPTNVLYELLDNGSVVLSGFLAGGSGAIGFEGGGFDEVLLRGGLAGGAFHDGGFNALQIDSIKSGDATAIPEPLTLSLFGAGLAGAVAIRRRKKSA